MTLIGLFGLRVTGFYSLFVLLQVLHLTLKESTTQITVFPSINEY